MKKSLDPHFRRDILKLICLISVLLGVFGLFIVAPSFFIPTLLSIVVTTLLSPWVASLERKGYSRPLSIALIFTLLGFVATSAGYLAIKAGIQEWNSLKQLTPDYFQSMIEKLKVFESDIKVLYPFLNPLNVTATLMKWYDQTGQWFIVHGPTLAGNFLSWSLIVPPLSFMLLNEGRTLKKRFFLLVPNRFFESFYLITTDIFDAISDYVRAKLLEALLVGLLTLVGLVIVGAPYALLFAGVAAVTNIIPYVGPFLGAIPAIIVTSFDAQMHGQGAGGVFSVTLIFILTNVIDTVVIFPLVVAKLVKLHPILLIIAVAVGQRYYGLVGMLISIPIATATKVILQEVYFAIYQHRPSLSVSVGLDEPVIETD